MSAMAAAVDDDAATASTVGEGKVLGEGACGSVSLQYFEGLPVAVKRFHDTPSSDYEREKKIGEQLSPKIATLMENSNAFWAKQACTNVVEYRGADDPTQTICYEYVPGKTVGEECVELMKRMRTTAMTQEAIEAMKKETYELIARIVSGVAALHRAGAFHGDLHTGNVICNAESGEIKLIDFGLSGKIFARTSGEIEFCAKIENDISNIICQAASAEERKQSLRELSTQLSALREIFLRNGEPTADIDAILGGGLDLSNPSIADHLNALLENIREESDDDECDIIDMANSMIPGILFKGSDCYVSGGIAATWTELNDLNNELPEGLRYTAERLTLFARLIEACNSDDTDVRPTAAQIGAFFELLAAGVTGSYGEIMAQAMELRPREYCFPMQPAAAPAIPAAE